MPCKAAVLKRPMQGEMYCGIKDVNFLTVCERVHGPYPSVEFLQGYRWVLPAKQEPTYVEYDVEASSARHPKWIVPAIGKSLVEASGCVGFAGVQFEGQSAINHWSMNINSFITNTGSRVSTNNGHNHKPATPIKIRLMEEQS